MVPSPPSAIGARLTSSSGRTACQPCLMAWATSTAVAEPLKESGAIKIRVIVDLLLWYWCAGDTWSAAKWF